MQRRATLQGEVNVLLANLTDMIDLMGTEEYDPDMAVQMLDK